MDEEHKNVKHEILDAFEILGLRKMLKTAWVFLTDPQTVLDSVNQGKTDFTKSVKFIISIGAPLILILNFTSLEFNQLVNELVSIDLHLYSQNPSIRAKAQLMLPVFAQLIKLLDGEYKPLFYLIVVGPLFAIVFFLFYKNDTRRFYFFISSAYYILGLTLFLELTGVVLSSLFPDHNHSSEKVSSYVLIILTCAGWWYFILKIIPDGKWVKRILKSGAVLFFIIVSSVLFVWGVSRGITNYILKDFKPSKYVMGEEVLTLTKELVTQGNLKVNTGLLVTDIEPNSPAQQSGLKEWDVITKLNGIEMVTNIDEVNVLRQLQSGDTVKAEVNRYGTNLLVNIPLSPIDSVYQTNRLILGFLPDDLYTPFNNPDYKGGIKVAEVVKDFPAEKAGLKVGDIVVGINRDSIRSWADYRMAKKQFDKMKPRDSVRLCVLRSNKKIILISLLHRTKPI